MYIFTECVHLPGIRSVAFMRCSKGHEILKKWKAKWPGECTFIYIFFQLGLYFFGEINIT